MVLDPKFRPEEISSREVEVGLKVGLTFASVVSQQRSYRLCLCDCSAQQLRQQLRSIGRFSEAGLHECHLSRKKSQRHFRANF